jgi:DNA mismatch repair protein MSH4
MLSGLILVPKSLTANTAKIGIDTLIYLKHTLKLLPDLTEILSSLINRDCNNQSTNNALLDSIVANMRLESLQNIKISIDTFLTDSTVYSKNAHEMRHQECFALRSGINGLLGNITFSQYFSIKYF